MGLSFFLFSAFGFMLRKILLIWWVSIKQILFLYSELLSALVGIVRDVGPLSQHKWVRQTVADGKCHLLWTKLLGVVFLGKVVLTRVTTDKRKQHGEKWRCLPLGEQGVRESECWIRVVMGRSKGTLLKSESRVLKEASETEKIHLGFLCSDWRCYIMGLVPRSLSDSRGSSISCKSWLTFGFSRPERGSGACAVTQTTGNAGARRTRKVRGEILPWIKIHAHEYGRGQQNAHRTRRQDLDLVHGGHRQEGHEQLGVGRSVVLCSGATTSWRAEAMRVSQNTYS